MEQRDGTTVYKLAPLEKSIYSLGDLQQILLAANRRYLDFISAIDDPSDGNKLVGKICEPKVDTSRTTPRLYRVDDGRVTPIDGDAVIAQPQPILERAAQA